MAKFEVGMDAILVNGRTLSQAELLRAEAYQASGFARLAVVFIVGCLGPIAAMIFLVQAINLEVIDHPRLWFGPIMLAASVVLGVVAGLIAMCWPKQWKIVVEYGHLGHKTLGACDSKNDAEAVAAQINEVIGAGR